VDARTSEMSQVSALTQSLSRARQSTQISRNPLSTTVKPSAARLSTLASRMVVKPLSSQYLRTGGGSMSGWA